MPFSARLRVFLLQKKPVWQTRVNNSLLVTPVRMWRHFVRFATHFYAHSNYRFLGDSTKKQTKLSIGCSIPFRLYHFTSINGRRRIHCHAESVQGYWITQLSRVCRVHSMRHFNCIQFFFCMWHNFSNKTASSMKTCFKRSSQLQPII